MNTISEKIYSVGAVDKDVRVFHGYHTPIGTSYNAYLIVDEKITLIDFVKAKFSGELLSNIKETIGDKKIDYIICNHVEPDHSGALPEIIKEYPDALIYGTASCKNELEIYYPDSKFEFKTVKAGDELNTGKYTFKFIPMPMVHWPDSMSTYLAEEKILFSNDALGQHIGTGEFSDSDLSAEKLFDRAADYYANIVMPFGMQVTKLLNEVSKYEIKTVCPSHGVILQKHIGDMVSRYAAWSKNECDENKCIIVYDTMWGTTAKMAERLKGEYESKNLNVEVINLSEKHYSYAMAKCIDAKYIIVGSPTLNNEMLPSVAAFLTYIKGLKPKNRIGQAFGSYGWSGESIKNIDSILKVMNFEVLEPVKAKWNI